MEKVDFQKKAVVALLGKIAEACGKAGVNPNITVSTRRSVTCFQLRRRGNCICAPAYYDNDLCIVLRGDVLTGNEQYAGRKLHERSGRD